MKRIILPSAILEFTWLVIDGFMEENSLAPFLKRAIPNIERPKKFSQPLLQDTLLLDFFCLKFIFIISYMYREFWSTTWKKSPPPQVAIPTQNPNLN